MKKILAMLLTALQLTATSPAEAESFDFVDWGDESLLLEPAGKVYMRGEMVAENLLKIVVVAEDFKQPVLGLSFTLNYDFASLNFLRYESGKFLEIGGDPIYLVKENEATGEVIFGETLRRSDSFPLGGDLVASFYFEIDQRQELFSFSFSETNVSTLDTVRQDIEPVAWEDYIFGKNDGDQALGAYNKANIFGLSSLGWPWYLMGSVLFAAILTIIVLKRGVDSQKGLSV